MNNHSLGNRFSPKANVLHDTSFMKWSHYSRNGKGEGTHSFRKSKKELNNPSHSKWLCCLKERQRPKKRNMINHFITGCVPLGMTIARQHNGWGITGEHLLFTNLFLEDVDIM
jgi:hypothetical protein